MKDEPINQCDGCRRGDVIVNGNHRDKRGHPYMTCTANRYAPDRAAASAALKDLAEQCAAYATAIMDRDKRIKQLEKGYDKLRTVNNRLVAKLDAAPSPAEPPAAPVQQEPVAFMGRAPGWGWDFEPGDSGPDPTWTECYPLYTHPDADLRAERDRLEAALADAAVTIGASATLLQRSERAEAERDSLRALLQEILDNHGHVFEHQIAEIRAALSGSTL